MATVAGVPDAVVATIEAISPTLVLPGRTAQIQFWYAQAIAQISSKLWGTNYYTVIGKVVAHYLVYFPTSGTMLDRTVVESENAPQNGSSSFAKVDMSNPASFWLETKPGRDYQNLLSRLLPGGACFVI